MELLLKKNIYRISFTLVFIFILNYLFFRIPFLYADEDEKSKMVQITAEKMNINNDKNYAEFIGKVEAVQTDFTINSENLKIYYKKKPDTAIDAEGSIRKIIAEGNVTIISGSRKAFAKKAEYDTDTEAFVLSGPQSKIIDGKNSITGTKITLNRANRNVQVEGNPDNRVTAFFYTKKQSDKKRLKTEKKPAEKPEIVIAQETKVGAECLEEYGVKTDKPAIDLASLDNLNTTIKSNEEGAIQKPFGKPAEKKATGPAADEATIGDLKNKLGIAKFNNITPYACEGLGKQFNTLLSDLLIKKYHKKIIVQPCDSNYSDFLFQINTNPIGNIDNTIPVEEGRKEGFNSIVTGTLVNVLTGQDTRGRLWFKKTYNFVRMRILLEAVDTETGTKIIDESYLIKFDIDDTTFEQIKSDKIIKLSLIEKKLKNIAGEIGGNLSEAMSEWQWNGYITAITKDNIFISSGQKTGLIPGNLFDVYEIKTVEGFQGSKFYLPGTKTGKIQITKVYPDNAEAVLVEGTKVRAGSMIKAASILKKP